MNGNGLVALSRKCGIPAATLENYRKGKNGPPPDKLDQIWKAALELAPVMDASILRGDVAISVSRVPELEQYQQLQLYSGPQPAGWASLDRYFYANAAFDENLYFELPDDAIKWTSLMQAPSDKVSTVAVFPRWYAPEMPLAGVKSRGDGWLYALLDLKKIPTFKTKERAGIPLRRMITDQFLVGMLTRGTDRSLHLFRQLGKMPNCGSVRERNEGKIRPDRKADSGVNRVFEMLPAWQHATSDEDRDLALDFEPDRYKLGEINALLQGNLRRRA